MTGMAMAKSASGGTGVGPGARRYFFCMCIPSIIFRQYVRNFFVMVKSVMTLIVNDDERRRLVSRRGGTYARGWHVAGILRVSVLFQGITASLRYNSSKF